MDIKNLNLNIKQNFVKLIEDFQYKNKGILVRINLKNVFPDCDHRIYKWLQLHNFITNKGYSNCPCVFIDIINQKFYPGRPGIQYINPINNHSITEEEFYNLLDILDHYPNITIIEKENINYIFNRKYKTVFIPK